MGAAKEAAVMNAEEAFENRDLGYPITVAPDVGESFRRFVQERGIRRFVVLADAGAAQHARRLTHGVPGCAGVLSFRLGERRKRLAYVETVITALAQTRADRQTTFVGVGGGVAADLFGFVAATYMRGVPYIHVATTLVAMADAAIGGKVGVDSGNGKNVVGLFADPVAVFAPTLALRTLPYCRLREGLAEVLKAAIIEGGDLFESLETLAPHPFWRWPWQSLVAQAAMVKIMFVNEDRFDRGARATLNLGHTFGHAIEAASGFRISHGAGVAIGLRAAGLLALRTGRFSHEEQLRVLALLALLKLPMRARLPADRIYDAMRFDKKRRDGDVRFVLPRAIGDVEYGVQVKARDVKAVIDRITQPPGAREFR